MAELFAGIRNPYQSRRPAPEPTGWIEAGLDLGEDLRLAHVEGHMDKVAFETLIDGWAVSGTVQEVQRGKLVLRQIDVRPFALLDYDPDTHEPEIREGTTPNAGVPTQILAKIDVSAIIRRVREERELVRAAREAERDGPTLHGSMSTWDTIGMALPVDRDALASQSIAAIAKQAGRPATYPDTLLATVAQAAIAIRERDGAGAVTKLLRNWLDDRLKRTHTVHDVENIIRAARERAYLAPTREGAPNFTPGLRLLADDSGA